MAVQLDTSGKDDLKTQFATPEGDYRLMTLSEYSRPNRVGYQNNQNSPQVRVSIVSLPAPPPPPPIGQLVAAGTTPNNNNSNNVALTTTKPQPFPNGLEHQTASGFSAAPVGGDRICFNYGKELYVYSYRGAKKATDLNKPIDKKLYKGTSPSCHDFNGSAATYEGAPLLVGFSTGQIQLVHPGRREQGKLFNEERYIDKTKVTCLKWIPGSQNQFLVSHASGCIYLYHEDLPCAAATPSYTPYKGGDGYIVLAAKSKATKNPLYKWCFGQHENASINEFCFSPCGQHLAVVSQDGFLRIFHYERMELVGIARSYFGGFLCVCWSPDGKYVVVGGEDDLVTVFSLHEQRVVARGQGHRSWVSVVAFDPYTTSYTSALDGSDELSDEELSLGGSTGRDQQRASHHHHHSAGAGYCHGDGATNPASCDKLSAQNRLATCYRLGSVSQDTQICLWDITEDVLRQSFGRVIKSANHTGVKDVLVNGTANGIGTEAKADKFGKAGKASVGTDTVDNVSFKPQLATLPTVGATVGSNSAYGGGGGTMKPIGSGGSSAYGNNLNCDDKANSDSSSDKESVDSKIIKRANSGATSEDSIAPGGSGGTGTTSTSSTKSSVVAAVIGGKKDKSTGERSKGTGAGAGAGAGDSQSNSGGQHSSTFNSITQRLTSLSFGNSGSGGSGGGAGSGSSTSSGSGGSSCDKNDKPSKSNTGGSGGSGGGKRSIITLGSKSFSNNSNSSNSNSNSLNNNHVLNSNNNNNNQSLLSSSGSPSGSGGGGSSSGGGGGGGGGGMSSTFSALMSSSLSKKGGGGGGTAGTGLIGGFAPCGRIASSYDPMKLIGTPACPRYDDCPVLEPLICKKIAHERLTALIFREDCFLTACQDGFVYTWARPGFVNIPQHLSSTPSAPPGGTVV